MPPSLKIHPSPFKSSLLSIPPSPFSPRLPISPPKRSPSEQARTAIFRKQQNSKFASANTSPTPAEPQHWRWQCHRCHRVYRIGVTRRCLEDGHLFCSETVPRKRNKRDRARRGVRQSACGNEFDYSGWRSWGTWKRNACEALDEGEQITNRAPPEGTERDCWRSCDYPSQCRWRRQFGVHVPVRTDMCVRSATEEDDHEKSEEVKKGSPGPYKTSMATTAAVTQEQATTFEEILGDASYSRSQSSSTPSISTIRSSASSKTRSVANGETSMISVSDLEQSALRRRGSKAHSPLMSGSLAANLTPSECKEASRVPWSVSPNDCKTSGKTSSDDLEMLHVEHRGPTRARKG